MTAIKYLLLFFLFLSFHSKVLSQSAFLSQQTKHQNLFDRLEIKSGKFSDQYFSNIKPYERESLVKYTASLLDSTAQTDSGYQPIMLSKADQYNLRSFYMNNQEWLNGERASYNSKQPILKKLYRTPAHFFEHYGQDYFITINPLIQVRQSMEKTGDTSFSNFINQRGLAVRGGIGKKIGFSFMAMDVQERGPSFFGEWVDSLKSVPGANFYKSFKRSAVDYIDARGYFTFQAQKYIRIQAGYDRQFIGNGYRSLLLSDFSGNQLFVKVNTRFWKLNYQNLFMELHAGAADNSTNNLVPRKYAAMHHLSMNLTKWLNIGLFEGVIFGRRDRFEFGYLNPVIFLRSIEGNLGSQDNAVIGADFKVNVLKRGLFYGQFILDEFNLAKMREQSGWWGNKTGLQLGFKYIDVASIKNLDFQAEWNRVRPFTYSHYDSVSNYSHYNQPLAHPLGANFNEYILVLKYQPLNRLTLSGRLIYWRQGIDSVSGYYSGSNIFKLNGDGRTAEFGYTMLNGVSRSVLNAAFHATYEIKENIYLDLHALYRKEEMAASANINSLIIGAGLRMNLWFRDYDY
ncbi:MAG: capsule assembly Wzi family protein [Bacteroidota bacterium]